MLQKSRIKYTPEAVDGMDEMFSYISKENMLAAESVLGQLDKQITQLLEFPHMGPVLSEDEYTLVDRGYR